MNFQRQMKLLKILTHLVFLIMQSMEPQNATVIYTKNRVDVWCGTQKW